MKLVADLHIHSHFSRATSQNLTFEHLTRWAQLKGVNVVGTGDIAHPGWLAEMHDKLVPAEEGLFRLNEEYAREVQKTVPPSCHAPVRFILGGEISNIYKRDGRTRKVHNVIFVPHFAAAGQLQLRLEKIGNIRSDGRPILGLDSRDLLETLLEVDPRGHLIPAHIWTPWFSMLGSKSGFDTVAECYGDLAVHIFALETGLSSDPPMNWRVSDLDRFTLVSNSDAHSPEKLAREATLFDTELAYDSLFGALQTSDPQSFRGTVEFFPEEGKYHLDGHRSCGVVWDPPTTIAHGGICSGCGKEVTVGVMHRVEELADRSEVGRPARIAPFYSLIPLPEVLGEVYGVGSGSKQVAIEYGKLLARLGPELFVLRDAPLDDISKAGGQRLAEAIGRMRRGEITAQAGYDGEYGVIRLFGSHLPAAGGQAGLFGEELISVPVKLAAAVPPAPESDDATIAPESQLALFDVSNREPGDARPWQGLVLPRAALLGGLNALQREAVQCLDSSVVIVAGPGTGKTRTLTHRIAYLILERGVDPASVLAITFTNKAAHEMTERLLALLGARAAAITVKTFHAFGAQLLRAHGTIDGIAPDFVICTEDDRAAVLLRACPELAASEVSALLWRISAAKNGALPAAEMDDTELVGLLLRYDRVLAESHVLDFDDLIARAVRLLEQHPDVLTQIQARFPWISVDEFQDVNAAQARFVRLLAAGGANLCVIGDPDQAIYGFRGADRRHFSTLLAVMPGARLLRLTENYRSTQLILDAARQVILHQVPASGGSETAPLQALADLAERVKLEVHTAASDRAEAEQVVHQIEQMVGGTSYFSLDSGRASGDVPARSRSFADFAVLYRLGVQSRLLVEAFDRSGMPYQTVGQSPLISDTYVREVLDCLWLLQNPRSRLHLLSLLSGRRHPVPSTVIDEIASETDRSALEGAMRRAARGTKSQRDYLHRMAAIFSDVTAVRRPVSRLIERLCSFLDPDGDNYKGERLERLVRLAAPYGDDLQAFLEATALQSETDAYDPRADRVTLMTLHAAKGLEFPVVFIVGCEEGLLPYAQDRKLSDVDEERRLFYVGMTRAMEQLVLMHARRRIMYGRSVENAPSRFVSDIEEALKAVSSQQSMRTARKEEKQLNLF